jgi:hypothetical protein
MQIDKSTKVEFERMSVPQRAAVVKLVKGYHAACARNGTVADDLNTVVRDSIAVVKAETRAGSRDDEVKVGRYEPYRSYEQYVGPVEYAKGWGGEK